jgi:hypothetical protein
MQIFQQQSGTSETGQSNDTSNADETTDERKPEIAEQRKATVMRKQPWKETRSCHEEEARVAAELPIAKREDQTT